MSTLFVYLLCSAASLVAALQPIVVAAIKRGVHPGTLQFVGKASCCCCCCCCFAADDACLACVLYKVRLCTCCGRPQPACWHAAKLHCCCNGRSTWAAVQAKAITQIAIVIDASKACALQEIAAGESTRALGRVLSGRAPARRRCPCFVALCVVKDLPEISERLSASNFEVALRAYHVNCHLLLAKFLGRQVRSELLAQLLGCSNCYAAGAATHLGASHGRQVRAPHSTSHGLAQHIQRAGTAHPTGRCALPTAHATGGRCTLPTAQEPTFRAACSVFARRSCPTASPCMTSARACTRSTRSRTRCSGRS
jgi:hypothetical protein